jgi:hypothetical protein
MPDVDKPRFAKKEMILREDGPGMKSCAFRLSAGSGFDFLSLGKHCRF